MIFRPDDDPEPWETWGIGADVDDRPQWMVELDVTYEDLRWEDRAREDQRRATHLRARETARLADQAALETLITEAIAAECPSNSKADRDRAREIRSAVRARPRSPDSCLWCGWNPRRAKAPLCQPCNMFRRRNDGRLPDERTLERRKDRELGR